MCKQTTIMLQNVSSNSLTKLVQTKKGKNNTLGGICGNLIIECVLFQWQCLAKKNDTTF